MKKALFVDDEVDFLETIEMVFSADKDLEVFTVSDSSLALQKAIAVKPDIIFLDVSMPKVDGGEVAVTLKENPITNNIPIVFITAVVTQAERGLHGGQIFLPKPIRSEEIKAIIRELLG